VAIVDEKGRLFGKVNLLDLVVVLAILAVVGRFGYRNYMGKQVAPAGEDKQIEVTMKFAAIQQPTIDFVPVGTQIYDSKSGGYLGKVVAVRSQPAIVFLLSEDGRMYETPSKERLDFYMVVAGRGRVSPNGVTLGDFEMKIGRTNYVKSPLWAGYGVTWNIDTNPKPR